MVFRSTFFPINTEELDVGFSKFYLVLLFELIAFFVLRDDNWEGVRSILIKTVVDKEMPLIFINSQKWSIIFQKSTLFFDFIVDKFHLIGYLISNKHSCWFDRDWFVVFDILGLWIIEHAIALFTLPSLIIYFNEFHSIKQVRIWLIMWPNINYYIELSFLADLSGS